jgi:Domain of unknown function (DUF222)
MDGQGVGAGARIDEIFNPDGDYNEEDGARRRGSVLRPQGRDGMSEQRGRIDPETRCYVEAIIRRDASGVSPDLSGSA